MPTNDRVIKLRVPRHLADQITAYASERSIDTSKACRALLHAGVAQAGLADTVQGALIKALPAAVDAAIAARMSSLRRTVTVAAALAAAQGAGATPPEAQAIAKQLADALRDEG